MGENKISFCTVSMNRLEHIMATIEKNIADNSDYENVEFLLLDYNSDDGLDNYVLENLSTYIESGKMTYYRTYTPQSFNRSHSRNLMFKLAAGDIVVNIDADNFTGKGFAAYVNEVFAGCENCFMTAIHRENHLNKHKDVLGRIGLLKSEFLKIRGFDEKLKGYGFEDYDLISRLENTGLQRKLISDQLFLNAIPHTDDKRIENEFMRMNLFKIFIRHISPSVSGFIILYKDHKIFFFSLVDDVTELSLENRRLPVIPLARRISVLNDSGQPGYWRKTGDEYEFDYNEQMNSALRYKIWNNSITASIAGVPVRYDEVTDNEFIDHIIVNYGLAYNKSIAEFNKAGSPEMTNPDDWGKDVVYKNFNLNHPLFT